MTTDLNRPCEGEPEWIPGYIGTELDVQSPELRKTTVDLVQFYSWRYRDPGNYVDELPTYPGPLNRYQQIANQVRQLSLSPEADEFGRIRPSERAVKFVLNCLYQLVTPGHRMPDPDDISTDHDGAIRVSWVAGSRFLEVVAPYEDENPPFIYHSEGDEFDLTHEVSGKALCEWLVWLTR